MSQGRHLGATFYNWEKHYGGLMPSEVKRMRHLEDENNRLKKIVADLTLDKAMLQDVGAVLLMRFEGIGSVDQASLCYPFSYGQKY